MVSAYDVIEPIVVDNRWLFDQKQDLLIDLESRTNSVKLKPVAVRVLSLLVRSPLVVLRRQQLLDEGWRSFGFEVCDNSLSQVIYSLREAFTALDPERMYIKTVPRIGYCLLAEVRMPASDESLPRTSLPALKPSDFLNDAVSADYEDVS